MKLEKIIPIIVALIFTFMTIGYALFGETVELNGDVTLTKPGVLEITDAYIIRDECSNLTSYDEPVYEGLHIEFRITSDSTEFEATYMITVTNNSNMAYTYTGFPISAIIEGYDYIPSVTSQVTNPTTGEELQPGEPIPVGASINIKLNMNFAIQNNRGGVTVIVNGDITASVDNTGDLLATITPTYGDLRGEGTKAEFELSVINTFKYNREFTLDSSNENIIIVDENGREINSFYISANSTQNYTIYLMVKEGSVFLTSPTETNILLSSNNVDTINVDKITLDVDIDETATDDEKPQVGNVTIGISENNPQIGEAIISWNRLDSGGSPIINYVITLYSTDTNQSTTYETGSSVTNYTVTGLEPGNYYAVVYGIDEAGNTGATECSITESNTYCAHSPVTNLKWEYTITYNLTDLQYEGETTALIYSQYESYLSVTSSGWFWNGTSLPNSITITMGGVELVSLEDYTYDSGTGRIVINRITDDVTITAEAGRAVCLIEGTKIRLADGSYKNVEDINYDDLLMVIDHENGGITYEYPIWIEKEGTTQSYQRTTFSDGSTLETVGIHNIFSAEYLRFVDVSNRDEFKVGTRVIKINSDGEREIVEVVKIEKIEKEANYYHVASTRYYNILANDFITTDGLEFSSFLYSFNEDLTWGKERDEYLASNDFFKYEDWKDYFPEYLFRGLRMEEAKNIYNHGMLDVECVLEKLNPNNTKELLKDSTGSTVWMVTTSDDVVTEETKNNIYIKLMIITL